MMKRRQPSDNNFSIKVMSVKMPLNSRLSSICPFSTLVTRTGTRFINSASSSTKTSTITWKPTSNLSFRAPSRKSRRRNENNRKTRIGRSSKPSSKKIEKWQDSPYYATISGGAGHSRRPALSPIVRTDGRNASTGNARWRRRLDAPVWRKYQKA